MSKVQFTYKTGRQKMIRKRDADLLARLGKGTYQTRDMVAARPQSDGFDQMDVDQLHELAKERGIKVHHKAGADKVRAALRGEAE